MSKHVATYLYNVILVLWMAEINCFVKKILRFENSVFPSPNLLVKMVVGGGGEVCAEPLNNNSSSPVPQPSPDSHPSIGEPILSAKPLFLPEYTKHVKHRGELSYLAPLGSENISAPYFKQCFFKGGYYPSDSQTPRLPVPRQK